MAVVVQAMLASERSGVCFTVDPSTGDRNHIVIEGARGQGEVVVVGQCRTRQLRRRRRTRVGDRRRRTSASRSSRSSRGADGGDLTVPVTDDGARVLDDDEVRTIARLAITARGTLRLPAGHRVGDRGRQDLAGAGASDHDPRQRGGAGTGRRRSRGDRLGRRAGHCVGRGADPDHSRRRAPPRRRRGARRADDQPRLGSDHPPRRPRWSPTAAG